MYSAYEVAGRALRILSALAGAQAAVDGAGHVLLPLPLVHRQLAGPACLPHIVQVGRGPGEAMSTCVTRGAHCAQPVHIAFNQCIGSDGTRPCLPGQTITVRMSVFWVSCA